jgi:hypothetical protein
VTAELRAALRISWGALPGAKGCFWLLLADQIPDVEWMDDDDGWDEASLDMQLMCCFPFACACACGSRCATTSKELQPVCTGPPLFVRPTPAHATAPPGHPRRLPTPPLRIRAAQAVRALRFHKAPHMALPLDKINP